MILRRQLQDLISRWWEKKKNRSKILQQQNFIYKFALTFVTSTYEIFRGGRISIYVENFVLTTLGDIVFLWRKKK